MADQKPADKMPITAAFVAEMRQLMGDEWVDRAMRESQQAKREHARLVALRGQEHADAWLARRKWPHGRFHAVEGGFEVGVPAP